MSDMLQRITDAAIADAAPALPTSQTTQVSELDLRLAAIEAWIDKWEPKLNALWLLVEERK